MLTYLLMLIKVFIEIIVTKILKKSLVVPRQKLSQILVLNKMY